MAKWFGKIGYVVTEETTPGVWEEQILEKDYFGDVTRHIGRVESSGDINDNLNISNNISVVADPFANENTQYMRYLTFNGAKWKITSAEIQYPRIILTIGGVYNGE